ncbi:MAG: class I SAM-dependent methyltransferase [Caldilineaceae bacterium]
MRNVAQTSRRPKAVTTINNSAGENRVPSGVLAALFLLSASGLMFEITITRLFSFFFQYHYAFLAVELAVLGLSLGAAVAYYRPAFLDKAGFFAGEPPLKPLLLLAALFPLLALGLVRLPWTEDVWPRALLALLPFLLMGLWTTLLFAQFPTQSGLLYTADLIGAGGGVLAALGLLSLGSPLSLVLLLGVVISAAALVVNITGTAGKNSLASTAPPRRWFLAKKADASAGTRQFASGAIAVIVLIVTGGLWLSNLGLGWLDHLPPSTAAPRDKTMLAVINNPVQAARVVRTVWSPFARVDVVETNDPKAKFVFADGGAGSVMVHYDGRPESVAYLRDTPEFIPFALSPVTQTLILGAGAGKDILLGLLAGAKQITAIEVNPATAEVTWADSDYNGHILHDPKVHLVVGDARTYVERSSQPVNLIYLNLVYTQAASPAGQALVESYTFTREAFRAYLEHLAPGGHLAIVTHNALEGSRAAVTALQAFNDLGVPSAKALDHLALSMVGSDDPTLRTSVLLIGRDPLSKATLDEYLAQSQQQQMQPLFIPSRFETAFAPLRKGASLQDFVVADAAYDLGPTSDDRPFFFKLDPGLPPAISQALSVAAILALVFLLVTLGQARQERPAQGRLLFIQVALLGLGFMLVEIPLIQRFQLLLGYPVLSLATVLGALLLAGGLGSWVSQRWPEQALLARVRFAALGIALVGLLYWLLLPTLLHSLLATPLAVRVFATILLTALPGFGMGSPFPSLLRLFKANQRGIALFWSLNGACSVVGSTLAMALAMTFGFGVALLGGVVSYAVLAALTWKGENA